MADKLSLVGFISELGISRSLAGRCGHVSRERTERRTKALYMVPDGHVPVAEDLLRRIERECRRESDWNCENVPAGTKAATTRAKKMLEIANDLRDLLGEQEGGTQ
ncbi:TPA: hypothetical protein ACNRRD_001903 [Pseudomonas aeruginosa]|uniref:hypothetical protein n=2 Tax=root TaxID=1 RepID=UPI0003B9CE1F|nr:MULTISPECIES: hypothetical protein [Pseudomonas]YP_009275543.1 hypothetical protein BH779_gp56 [Pseudomonas phage JBD44]QVJ12493.1 hypothetical protein [Pseudomonas phage PSA04]AMD42717.1 hypothetical protein JBD44_56 [Pseudomonas phage JBD44]EKU3994895.1 hypothetical protein [Pseudomonas aeruginosa]EKX3885595.1 hypothetical protein [Pseudomonas aeruginosa]ELK7310595.1 hypothetical protein [Pseudomonas aeruginosa]